MARSLSRGKRWVTAVTSARAAFNALTEAYGDFETAMSDVKDIQSEYEEWKDNLPENLQQSPLGEKLEAVCDLDIEGATLELSEIETVLDEAEGIELPMGFGRD